MDDGRPRDVGFKRENHPTRKVIPPQDSRPVKHCPVAGDARERSIDSLQSRVANTLDGLYVCFEVGRGEDEFPAGRSEVSWDGTNRSGSRVAAGVYVVRIESGGKEALRKAVVLR